MVDLLSRRYTKENPRTLHPSDSVSVFQKTITSHVSHLPILGGFLLFPASVTRALPKRPSFSVPVPCPRAMPAAAPCAGPRAAAYSAPPAPIASPPWSARAPPGQSSPWSLHDPVAQWNPFSIFLGEGFQLRSSNKKHVSMTLEKWAHDPFIFGNDPMF